MSGAVCGGRDCSPARAWSFRELFSFFGYPMSDFKELGMFSSRLGNEPCSLASPNRRQASQGMVRFQHLASALADDNAGRHGITGDDARHDRSVRNPQLIDAVNPETVVHD